MAQIQNVMNALGSSQPSPPSPQSGTQDPPSSMGDMFSPENLEKMKSIVEGMGFGAPQSSPSPASSGSGSGDMFSPENISKIKSIVDGLGLTGGAREQSPSSGDMFSPQNLEKIKTVLEDDSKNKERINLLLALKPYLSQERAPKIDFAVKVLQLSKFTGLFKDYFKK